MPAPVTRHPFLGFGDAPVAACGERERRRERRHLLRPPRRRPKPHSER